MSLTINTSSFIIIISILAFILILLSITCITLLCHIHTMKVKIGDISNMMFFILKKHQSLRDSSDAINSHLLIIDDNINTLSNNTVRVIDELKKSASKSKILPTPELASMMRATIKEAITAEVILSRNLRIPKRDSTKNVVLTTINTYPYVDKEYIVKLCLAMIEDFTSDIK